MSESPYKVHKRQRTVNTAVDAITEAVADFIVHTVFRKKPAELKFDVEQERLTQFLGKTQDAWVELEEIRTRCKRTCRFRIVLGTIISLAIIVIAIGLILFPLILAALFTLFAFSYWAAQAKIEFLDTFNKLIKPALMKQLPNFQYDPNGFIPPQILDRSEIMPKKYHDDLTRQEDFLLYEKEGIKAEVVDCELAKYSRNRNGGTSVSKVFGGLIIRLTFEKAFSSRVVLHANWGIVSFMQPKPLGKDKKIELPNSPLTKHFDIYTEDKAYAEQLLNPEFLQEYKIFCDKLDIARPEFSLYDNQCLLLLHRPKGLFTPPGLGGRLDKEKVAKPYLQEVVMVEELFQMIKKHLN